MFIWLQTISETINRLLWGPATLVLFLAAGIWFTCGTGWLQITKIKAIFQNTIGSLNRKNKDGISPFQAMSTALAGTMGVGNITGIAAAMTLGGAGSVFWMWISAFFGMMTKYAEVLLAVQYRQKGLNGYFGGPMYYMEYGVGSRKMAILFCSLCIAASLGVGNVTQSNAIALAAQDLWRLPLWFTGILTALLIGLVIVGGIRRIASVTQLVIPFLSLAYLIACAAVLIQKSEQIPHALWQIVSSAFSPASAAGGVAGYGISQAVRYGFARGVFSNEAGLGSAPIAHAAADAKHPAIQGMWGIFEVFADTLVVCTLTALVILISGVADGGFLGAGMTAQAFETVLGPWGGWMVSFSLIFYAGAAMLGWAFYGEQSLSYLLPDRKRAIFCYRAVFLLCCFLGAVTGIELVWSIADILNGLMALPNLSAILLLSGKVFSVTKEFFHAEQKTKSKKCARLF